jgi:hypothetical protein
MRIITVLMDKSIFVDSVIMAFKPKFWLEVAIGDGTMIEKVPSTMSTIGPIKFTKKYFITRYGKIESDRIILRKRGVNAEQVVEEVITDVVPGDRKVTRKVTLSNANCSMLVGLGRPKLAKKMFDMVETSYLSIQK